MSEEKFDAIIVGGGLAGCSAAIVLANAGLEVLLVERGDFCGAKNMTGGRLYGHSLEKIIPNFAEEAPVERKITKEKVSLMSPEDVRRRGFMQVINVPYGEARSRPREVLSTTSISYDPHTQDAEQGPQCQVSSPRHLSSTRCARKADATSQVSNAPATKIGRAHV